jgi:hypothetical protein
MIGTFETLGYLLALLRGRRVHDDPSGPMLVFKTSGNMRRNLLNQVLADADLLAAESVISDLALNIDLSSFMREFPSPRCSYFTEHKRRNNNSFLLLGDSILPAAEYNCGRSTHARIRIIFVFGQFRDKTMYLAF